MILHIVNMLLMVQILAYQRIQALEEFKQSHVLVMKPVLVIKRKKQYYNHYLLAYHISVCYIKNSRDQSKHACSIKCLWKLGTSGNKELKLKSWVSGLLRWSKYSTLGIT